MGQVPYLQGNWQEVTVSSQEIVEQTPATYRQVHHWSSAGYLRPLNPQPGSGSNLTYPDEEMHVARAMAVLTKAGLLPTAACKVARGIPLPGGVSVIVPTLGIWGQAQEQAEP